MVCGCSPNKADTTTNVTSESIYRLVEKFNPTDEYKRYKANEKYEISDSLNIVFKALYQQNENILKDTNYRKPILFLLEKIFLEKYASIGNKEAFYVNNAGTWFLGNKPGFVQFATNIVMKIPFDSKQTYEDYLNKSRDIVCIDDIVKEVSRYNIEGTQYKATHLKCVELMPTNCLSEK